jgi:tetratricopeptide (TPR) repeat protein
LALGIALQALRRHEEALQRFASVSPDAAEKASACVHAVYSQLALGRAEAALQAAAEACARAPRSWQAQAARGQAELALGRSRQAETAFLDALAIDPGSAELWTQLAAARRQHSDPSGAETALGQALAREPGHAGAKAALAALTAEVTRTGEPSAEGPSRADSGLRVWAPADLRVALGLTVDYLAKKPTFARLAFGEWTGTLAHQVRRGHQFFVVDSEQRIVGFLGWALTERALAQAWVEGRTGLRDDQCRDGDCVIVNALAADTRAAMQFLQRTVRELFKDKSAFYFKRFYPDGRARPIRLEILAFAAGRVVGQGSASPASMD